MDSQTAAPPGRFGSVSEHADALRWLYSFLRPQKRRIVVLVGLSLIATVLVLAQPYLTKLIIDDGLMASDFGALLTFSLLLLLIGVVATLLSGFNRIQHTKLSGNVLFALREDVYCHLQTLSPRFFAKQRTGDIISRMDRDVTEIQRFAVDTLFTTFSGLLGLLGTLGMLLLLSWKMSLVLILLIPLELAYLQWIRPKVQIRNRKVRERTADISSFFTETLPAMKFIQTSGAEAREADKLGHLNRLFLGDLVQLQITEFVASAIPSLLVSITRALVFLLGGYWVIQGQFELGSLIAFSAYLAMALGPVQSLLGLYLGWQRLVVSLERVRFLRDQQPEIDRSNTRAVPAGLSGELELDNMCFSHQPSARIFNHANLKIPAGAKVGIFGPSGIGKSTLIDLIQRHLPLDEGRILIDGHNVADFDVLQWRKAIAVVSQQTVIFRDSIANNIRYCQPLANDQQVQQVVQRAGLASLLKRLPDGINSMVGERGADLSGGECQRIALARALLQQPVVLILDEPTSSVDPELEKQMIMAVDELFATTTRLIVSHREAPLEDADLQLTIKDGLLTHANQTQSVGACG